MKLSESIRKTEEKYEERQRGEVWETAENISTLYILQQGHSFACNRDISFVSNTLPVVYFLCCLIKTGIPKKILLLLRWQLKIEREIYRMFVND
jgi:hypothetical protein